MRTKEQAASDLDAAIWRLLELGVEEDIIREWIDNAFEDAQR